MTKSSQEPVTMWFPTSSSGNPYQRLLIKALERENVDIIDLELSTIFPLTSQGVRSESVDLIHIDWMYQFYMSKPTNLNLINVLVTIVRSFTFILDLCIVSISDTGLIWTVHDKYQHEREFQRTERLVNEATFVLADEIVVKCDAAGRIIENEYTFADMDTFQAIRDGNYQGVYPDTTSQQEARERLSVDENTFVYLYFGFIRRYKGVDTLIKAFKHSDQLNAELWVVGNPANEDLEQELRRLSTEEENVKLTLEFIPEESVQQYLNMADVLVLPFRDILNSGSIYLGLTFGLPIITPRIGCIPSVVSNENEELLYDGSTEMLRETLNKAYSHVNLNEISSANRKQGRELGWEEPAQELSSLYHQVS